MKHLTRLISLAVLTSTLGGCMTQGQGLLPTNEERSAAAIYKKVIQDNRRANLGNLANLDLSSDFKQDRGFGLKYSALMQGKYSALMQGEVNKVNKKFLTLPNPQIPMYIFAHRVQAGSEAIPVLGYTTVFHLYKQEQFALPSERY